MMQLTDAQIETLEKMLRYHIVAQLHNRTLIMVYEQMYHNASVVDISGRVYALSRYLAMIDRGSQRLVGQ
jgi:hypothetical protein